MSKHIKFEIVDVVKDEVHVRITEQTHRMLEFGEDWDFFVASNGYKLSSTIQPPEVYRNECIVRGEKKDDNDILIFVCLELFAKFRQAVAEYNEYFKDTKDTKDEKEPLIRPIGEVFDYTTPNGEVVKLEVCEVSIGICCDGCFFEKNRELCDNCQRENYITGHCSFHHRKYKNEVIFKKVEDEPKFKIGDWVYNILDGSYFKNEDESAFYDSFDDIYAPARKRLKTFEELQELIGKKYIAEYDNIIIVAMFKCVSLIKDTNAINVNASLLLEDFAKKCEFLDGSSVYEFEHLNENGEWVK